MTWLALVLALTLGGVAHAEDHKQWSVHQWLTEYYALQAAGADADQLGQILESAAGGSGHSPQLDQQLAGEQGRSASRAGDRRATAAHYTRALEGPDEAITAFARAELDRLGAELVAEARSARVRGDLETAEAFLKLAAELGSEEDAVSAELIQVLQARERGEGNDGDLGYIGPPVPQLESGPALSAFYRAKADGADGAALSALLDEAEPAGAEPQRVAAERGAIALAADDRIAAGRHVLAALDGPDPGLSAAMRLELGALQHHWLTAFQEHKDAGELERAEASLRMAGDVNADPQRLAWERAWLAQAAGQPDAATEHLQAAAVGPNRELGQKAEAELAARQPQQAGWIPHIERSIAHREAEEWDEAEAALDDALEAGASSQVVELHRGYVDRSSGHPFAARKHFQAAKDGDDEAITKQAKGELRYTAKPLWADVYGEGFGWVRVWPDEPDFANFAGMLRVRGYLHPIPTIDLDPYIFFQISGDVRSRQNGGPANLGQPLIYADNTAILGGGVLFRFWKRQISLWAQAGAAFPWVKRDTDPDVQLDVQVGAAFTFASPGCQPAWGKPAYVTAKFCGEFYGDAVYRNRPYHNLFFSARGRLGLHYLVTGPVAWAPVFEARFAKDVLNDYWNNLFDVGLGHRWRLMGPIGIDLMLGVHAGTYLGLFRLDQPPDPLGYVDLRLQVAGYASF